MATQFAGFTRRGQRQEAVAQVFFGGREQGRSVRFFANPLAFVSFEEEGTGRQVSREEFFAEVATCPTFFEQPASEAEVRAQFEQRFGCTVEEAAEAAEEAQRRRPVFTVVE